MNVFLMTILVILLLVPAVYMIWEKRAAQKKQNEIPVFAEGHFKPENLIESVRRALNDRIFDESVSSGPVDMKRKIMQARLRNAVREACQGDMGDREYLKEYIRETLQNDLGVNEGTIGQVFDFDDPDRLSARDLFGYLYAVYTRVFGIHVFRHMTEDFGWNSDRTDEKGRMRGIINEKMIRDAFDECMYEGTFPDRLEMLTQRCYESLYGHDAADILIMDPDIDGVSGGTGGKTRVEYNYLEELFGPEKPKEDNIWDTIYCVYRGRLIRMSFLSFERQENLERVVRNIYRYNARTTLSKRDPVLQSSMKNNARVMVARPPVSDGWTFFVRKFSSSDVSSIESLITDEGCGFVIRLLKGIVKGELNFVISGNTGGGKTTLVKALIEYIDPKYALRIVESNFELNINNLYPDRNVHVMQERGDFTIHDAIAACKKTDTDVLILGEVNEPKVAGAFIQVAQSGSRMAITTLHHETTRKLIEYMRNALVCEWGISDISVAEKQVVDSINFDIHMVHDTDGHHYIERITQIIPAEEEGSPHGNSDNTGKSQSTANSKNYRLKNIVIFDRRNRQYKICGRVEGKPAGRIGKEWYEGIGNS